MDIYVVESFAEVLPHATGHSRGVEAEGFTGEGRLFVHLLPLDERALKSLGQVDSALNRHGPANGEWWVVDANRAVAHWPGLPGLRARAQRGKPVSLKDQLKNGASGDGTPSRGQGSTRTTRRAATSSDSRRGTSAAAQPASRPAARAGTRKTSPKR
jgi:hypothetical protein